MEIVEVGPTRLCVQPLEVICVVEAAVFLCKSLPEVTLPLLRSTSPHLRLLIFNFLRGHLRNTYGYIREEVFGNCAALVNILWELIEDAPITKLSLNDLETLNYDRSYRYNPQNKNFEKLIQANVTKHIYHLSLKLEEVEVIPKIAANQESFPALQKLSVWLTEYYTGASLAELAKISSLTQLDLDHWELPEKSGSFIQKFTNLKSLRVGSASHYTSWIERDVNIISMPALQAIVTLTQIERLRLVNCAQLTPELVDTVLQLPRLRALDLSFYPHETFGTTTINTSLEKLKIAPQNEHKLRNVLAAAAKSFPRLYHLKIRNHFRLSLFPSQSDFGGGPAAIMAEEEKIDFEFPHLSIFKMRHVGDISALLSGMPNLTSLYLSEFESYDSRFNFQSEKIKYLDLRARNEELSGQDPVRWYHVKCKTDHLAKFVNVERLRLEKVMKLRDIYTLQGKLPKLAELTIVVKPPVTRSLVLMLQTAFPALKKCVLIHENPGYWEPEPPEETQTVYFPDASMRVPWSPPPEEVAKPAKKNAEAHSNSYEEEEEEGGRNFYRGGRGESRWSRDRDEDDDDEREY